MRGEAECLVADRVQRWDLCGPNRIAVSNLEPGGLRHLAIITNALSFRQPSVTLLKVQVHTPSRMPSCMYCSVVITVHTCWVKPRYLHRLKAEIIRVLVLKY